jgi:hypothetical protein
MVNMPLFNNASAIDYAPSQSPKPSKGFYSALEDIQPDHTFIVAPVIEGWPVDNATDIVNLRELIHAVP